MQGVVVEVGKIKATYPLVETAAAVMVHGMVVVDKMVQPILGVEEEVEVRDLEQVVEMVDLE